MIIKYFTLQDFFKSETAIKNNIFNVPKSFEILDNLMYTAQQMDKIREFLGKPIYPTSWFRSPELNKIAKGSKYSQHIKGEAVDFVSFNYGTPEKVCSGILESGVLFDQLILEKNQWVHCSFVKNGNRKQYIELV